MTSPRVLELERGVCARSIQYVYTDTQCRPGDKAYCSGVPKLWRETIEEHRRTVHDTIVETTWALLAERGPLAVTMSEIAAKAGVGRATLYKYFPDVESILLAGHQRHVDAHLERLTALRDGPGTAMARLEAVLETYALIAYHRERHGSQELAALLHRGEHVTRAQRRIVDLVRDLIVEGKEAGRLRGDVSPDELANFCVHALVGASSAHSEAAVRRLVDVTMAGLAR
jgi:AcrR family transcriptional regulator